MNLPFSHLRVSSEFSITHGLLTIDQIVDKAKEYSTPSVALTDNLNMFGQTYLNYLLRQLMVWSILLLCLQFDQWSAIHG